jgi:hypothetical protein
MPSSESTMTSLYPAFQADDTLVEIIPAFDLHGKIPVHSSVPSGPFKAGMAAVVPLWMAIFLHQRSLATICPPVWWTTANLSAIIAFEQKDPSLFPTDNAKRLPANYFEISKRLTSTSKAVVENHLALALLVQDLLDIRLDKLRQQFVTLLKEGETSDVMVAVTGIGTQELALLRGFVTQSLADQYFMAKEAPTKESSSTKTAAEKGATSATANADAIKPGDAAAARRPKLSLRRFRK